mmetsp:Transcript_105433/g.278435  ORF Transcript_105433/g.278435 Transcript_105433/m.278435 type:complete len:465 (+) Transcript_105433:767-2161(+)
MRTTPRSRRTPRPFSRLAWREHDARSHPMRCRLRTRQRHGSGRLISPGLHSNWGHWRHCWATMLGAGRPQDERPGRRAGWGALARPLHVGQVVLGAHHPVHEQGDSTYHDALQDDEHRDDEVPPADAAAPPRAGVVLGNRIVLGQLVDVERAYGPVSLLELLRVERHELLAGHPLGKPGAIPREGAAGPVAAEGQVEHQLHARKVLLRAVEAQPEEGVGRAPGLRRGGPLRDVARLPATGPEPGPEVPALGSPLRGVSATAHLVEAWADGVHRALLDATLVVELAGGVDVAVGGPGVRRPWRPAAGHVLAGPHLGLVAPVRGVQRGGGADLVVDPLDHIVLAQRRPRVVGVLPVHPEGGPRAAPRGHVVDACDEEARIERVLGPDAHGPAASAPCVRRHVGTQVHPVAGGVGQARGQRLGAIYVDDVPAGGVGRTVKVPLVEEVGPHVGAVFQVPASNRHSSLG